MTVADLQPKQLDAMGTTIIIMYGRKPFEYAVYRTADRVLVHFADAEDVAREQRKSLARLNPLRGEINGLVDRWRASKNPRKADKAERYDRRVGDALVVAFGDDVAGAQTLLNEIRTSWTPCCASSSASERARDRVEPATPAWEPDRRRRAAAPRHGRQRARARRATVAHERRRQRASGMMRSTTRHSASTSCAGRYAMAPGSVAR